MVGRLDSIFKFMREVYPANVHTRWNKTPYMEDVAGREELNAIVGKDGIFETVPGHEWSCGVLWREMELACTSLDAVVDSTEVFARILFHDVGETLKGDESLALKIDKGLEAGKDGEREDYIFLISYLPADEQKGLLQWFDDFESTGGKGLPLEARVARWIDHIQGDHFARVYGKNLPDHSKKIEKIIRIRSALRSRELIDALKEEGLTGDRRELFNNAVREVEMVSEYHFAQWRAVGVEMDLSDLGF